MYSLRILGVAALIAGLVANAAATDRIVPNALLTIDQNRPTVIERIVGEWGDRLASSSAGIPPAQLREILGGLRADALLAASLAGSLDGLRDVVATAMTSTTPIKPGRVMPMALGDVNTDLVYTPITPCRILDTRNGTIAPYNSVLVGGAAVAVTANLANFAPQGGSATNCGLPSSFQAIAVTFTVLNPNFDAFLAASNTSNFATLTQSVVMDFSANRGLANTGIVPVDANVKFYLGLPSQVTTHVIADAVGVLRRPGNYGGTHVINGTYATDSGGFNNTTGGDYSTVAGGFNNTAGGGYSAVAGGSNNTASQNYSTVAGGYNNTASAFYSAVGGGGSNTASGQNSTVAGGDSNTASGFASTVAGGDSNIATANYSFAAGRNAKAKEAGMFVWADSRIFDFDTTLLRAPGLSTDTFNVRATQGVYFATGINNLTGVPTWACYAVSGAGWTCTSDRNVKRNLQRVDGKAALGKVAAMPIYHWQPKDGPNAEVRHLGPMAQDFHAAFGLGDSDKGIGMQDADGVALAAIQGLHQMMGEKDRQIAQLKRKLQAIEAKLGL